MRIRTGRNDDADAVATVCRATARAGMPQPADVVDPELVALVYARPYLALEPQTCRLLVQEDVAVGYVVGARCSPTFYARCRREWAPQHLPRPVGADPGLVRKLTDPESALPAGVDAYPSHLHINLLPQARGGGNGVRLLESFVDGLRQARSPGVHLQVDAANRAATAFYERCGFARLAEHAGSLTMVRSLDSPRA
jgi:ribosomal protein S18 acetylase RimI-like enzyme